MKRTDPILERWPRILDRKGGSPAVFNPTGEIVQTFRQIDDRARQFEGKIEDWQVGSVLAVQIGNHEDWPAVLIACLRRGLVLLPLEQSISEQRRDAALEICNAAGLVTAATGSSLEVLRMKTLAATTDWGEKAPSLLKLTSGTTAAPRTIRFRGEQLLADCDQICDTKGISDADLNFAVIPISHSYGFSNLLSPLVARGVPMVVSRDRTPRAVLEDLATTKATVFPGTPVFFQAFCEIDNAPPLPSLRLCISAGAPLPLAIAKKFRERFGLAVHSFYGASECGGICYDREAKLEIEGFVGAPMNAVDVELLDSEAEGSLIRVHSAAAGDGYFPEPDEARLGDGFFVPDDLLVRHGDGFRIVGRVSDVINVAGKKVSPAEIEQALLGCPGVRQAVAFGRAGAGGLRNEEIAACVVAGGGVDEAAVLAACRKILSAWQVPKRIFIVETIPANERGKISRKDLAKRYAL